MIPCLIFLHNLYCEAYHFLILQYYLNQKILINISYHFIQFIRILGLLNLFQKLINLVFILK